MEEMEGSTSDDTATVESAMAEKLALNACMKPLEGGIKKAPLRAGRNGSTLPGSPKWSHVVKKSRRQSPGQATTNSKWQHPTHRGPGQKRKPGSLAIVSTGTGCNIKVVKTKLVSVFASKLSPDLEMEFLSAYLRDKLGRDVTCEKIPTAHNRFGSFKVSAECNELGEMYNSELWPEGAYVRRFHEPRRARDNGASTLDLPDVGGMSVLAGVEDAHHLL